MRRVRKELGDKEARLGSLCLHHLILALLLYQLLINLSTYQLILVLTRKDTDAVVKVTVSFPSGVCGT